MSRRAITQDGAGWMRRRLHEALDLVECILRPVPSSKSAEASILVLELRRKIIDLFPDPETDGS